ncbi:MAG: serine/threonine-protein kinase [Butyrivibrio sp.]|nr:serine/threonine-protein kinase [Butyrivibrio sp.]
MRCNNCFEEYDGVLEVCPYCGYYEGQSSENDDKLVVGTLLMSRYIIGEVLGRGGFGITYKAYDKKLERRVAVKEYYPTSLQIVSRTPGTTDVVVNKRENVQVYIDGRKRFMREARNTTKFVGYPNIVDILDYFEENNTAYYVMELLEGKTLSGLLKEDIPDGKLDCEAAVPIISDVGAALTAVHNAGYIHRDVAPDNIFICTNGTVKLIDFGAARFSENENLSIVLKAGYAPAEQYESVSKQGAYTDVYALGATMYRVVTGVKPDESTNRKIKDAVLPPNEIDSSIPENISNAIMIAMSIERHLRYQTVNEFITAITGTRKVHTLQHIKKRRKRNRIVGIAASVILVAGLAAYFSFGWNRQKEEATLPDAALTVWYVLEDDSGAESHKAKGIEQTIADFMLMYPNVTIESTAVPKSEYTDRLEAAKASGNAPNIFESTDLETRFVEDAVGLGGVIEQITPANSYFFERYEEYYPAKKCVPTSFVMPIVYVNTSVIGEYPEVFSDLSEFEAGGELTYSVDTAWEQYYGDRASLSAYECIPGGIEAFLSEESAVYMGSSADIEEIYSSMTGKCAHMTLDGSEVECRAGSEWSVSDSPRDEKTAALRFLAYLIEDPTAQDYLYMQGDYGDKTKLPINKDAVKTLISDDAQFYKKILEEADSFGYTEKAR